MTWTIEPHGDGYALYSGRDDMHHGMNLVYLSEPDANWEQTKALIEAAPDMLKALERVLACRGGDSDGFETFWVGHSTFLEVEAAIKKARGEK